MKCQRCDYHILDLSIKLARALDEVDYWEGFWK